MVSYYESQLKYDMTRFVSENAFCDLAAGSHEVT